MMLHPSDRSVLARELGLVGGDEIPRRGVAGLLRAALARWGLSPRRALTRYARQQLEAVHFTEQSTAVVVGNVLDNLETLRECDQVVIGSERYVAPGSSRWIRTGLHRVTLLGVDPTPVGLSIWEPLTQRDVVRRVRFESEQELEALDGSAFEECSLETWLRPLHYLTHHTRRVGHPVRDDQVTLRDFWQVLVDAVMVEGRPVGSDADLRVLAGTPGERFGKYNAPQCEGRWTTEPEDGEWCGFRRGYGDAHWHPVVVMVAGTERRVFDLYDHDEWHWALLARAQARDAREVVRESERTLELTFPPPIQLATAMDLVAPRLRAWEWEIPEGAARFWADLL
ncbi:MAG TPA: hypothetical protein VF710_11685 [Longimicrobium sp.]|jgi:hypothetical protein